jgi:hypothetical protein
MNLVSSLCVVCLSLPIGATAWAQTTCMLPVSAYLTDDAGGPLDGSVDLELRFYESEGAAAVPAECRSFTGLAVSGGWMHIAVDACSAPEPPDCGAVALTSLLGDGLSDLWVGIWIGGVELEPRQRIGSVPYAVRAAAAGDADTIQGRGPEAFEASGTVTVHESGEGAHHSATSDGIDITPNSVSVGDTVVLPGEIDFGAEADDVLTAEMVRTLTGGGGADVLHSHASGSGSGACYTVWSVATCAEGFTPTYTGVLVESISLWGGGGITATPLCMADEGISTFTAFGAPFSRYLVTAGGTVGVESVGFDDVRVVCAVCCP